MLKYPSKFHSRMTSKTFYIIFRHTLDYLGMLVSELLAT